MSDYDSFVHGGVSFPLAQSTTNSLLEDADPAIFHALAFFAAVLDLHLRPRLHAAGLVHGIKFDDIAPTKITVEPTPFLQSTQFRFPILALYRESEQQAEHTMAYEKDTSEWTLAFVLPFLPPAARNALNPALRAATRIIAHRLRDGFDPNYLAGANVWAAAGIMSARFVSAHYGAYEPVENVSESYPSVAMTLSVVERDMPIPGFVGLNAVDHESRLVNANQTTINDFVDFASDVIPPGPTRGHT